MYSSIKLKNFYSFNYLSFHEKINSIILAHIHIDCKFFVELYHLTLITIF